MENFYMTLLSDACRNEFPENSPTNYVTRLMNRIEFDGKWEVAVAEASIPIRWANVFTENTIRTWSRHIAKPQLGGQWNSSKVPKRAYKSPRMLCDVLDRIYKNLLKNAFPTPNSGESFKFDNVTGVLTIKLLSRTQVTRELAAILGLPVPDDESEWVDIPYLQEGQTLDTPADHNRISEGVILQPIKTICDLRRGIHHIFVYSDIVEYVPVGDVGAPLLRVIPMPNNSDADPIAFNHTFTFHHPHYIPVNRPIIETVEIDLRSDRGNRVPFVSGKSIVTLHFRRRRPL